MNPTTELKQLNPDELAVLAGVRAAVKERGRDYVYVLDPDFGADPETGKQAPCVYALEGRPACIVGVAFSKVSPEAIGALDPTPGTIMAIYQVHDRSFDSERSWAPTGAPELGKGFVLALQAAQDVQDGGGTWGYALELFLDEIERRGYDIPEEDA